MGEGETLARHETQLLELAKRRSLEIGDIYREIVSGDTIAARPMMQKLLSEVGDGMWDGVIVMEIERLARGDTIDQGIVMRTFTYSDTKIITPARDYDPACEADSEYFEFSLFMSRREYKTINRRMQAGRIASVKEGNYIGSLPPYGYRKVHDLQSRVFTLEPIPEEAEVVKLMFRLSLENKGASCIATHLNSMDIKPRKSAKWTSSSVRDILENPVYCGYLRWNWRKSVKSVSDGKVKTPHTPFGGTMKNSFAGLLYCEYCGHVMVRRPKKNGGAMMICNYPDCICVGSDMDYISDMILSALTDSYNDYIALAKEQDTAPESIDTSVITTEIKKAEKQRQKLYELLEQEIYTPELFAERNKILTERLAGLRKRAGEINAAKQQITPSAAAAKIKHIIDCYEACCDGTEKNNLLKEVCRRIIYGKTKSSRWSSPDAHITIEYDF